jgi:N-acetylglucosaminyldiphosphoundecaprenol N-acetyl-beta-D-mannosaminyltransferase
MESNIIEIIRLKAKEQENLSESTQELVAFLNPFSYLKLRKKLYLLEEMDTLHFDGIVLSCLINLLGVRQERTSFDMTSLAPIVFKNAELQKKSIYIIGSMQGVAEEVVKKLKQEYPSLQVKGVRNGFFSSEEERNLVLDEIKSRQPKIVIVGMGTPYQEEFLVDLKKKGWIGTAYTCGGFLHQTAQAGLVYYPPWINKMNLRWLYRIWDEPKLLKRYLLSYPIFLFVFLYDVIMAMKKK